MAQTSLFLQGWNKLPVELKLGIIRYAVPSSETLTRVQFDRHHHGMMRKGSNFATEVMPLLACPPIAQIAMEAFYTQNTINLRRQMFFLPPQRFDTFLRHIKTSVALEVWNFRAMAGFFAGGVRLSNLHTFEIVIVIQHRTLGFASLTQQDQIELVRSLPSISIRARELVVDITRGNGRTEPFHVG